MNNDEPILDELRKISAWADMQRKISKGSLIVVAVIVPVLLVAGILMERQVSRKLESLRGEETPDWYNVDENVRRGEFDQAIQIGETLIRKTPLNPEAHRRLAGVYLAAGDVAKAREHYAEAYRLFPSEEYEKLVKAIEKRIQAEGL